MTRRGTIHGQESRLGGGPKCPQSRQRTAHDRSPNPIGSPYAASLIQNRLADTGISLPRGGRIRLIGSEADGSHFALLVPVVLLSTLTAKAPGDDLTHTAPFGAGSALVNFGRTSGGHLLMGSAMSGGVRRFMRFMRLWTMLALLPPLLAGLTVTTLPLSARAADDRVNPLAELSSPKERDLKDDSQLYRIVPKSTRRPGLSLVLPRHKSSVVSRSGNPYM